MDGAQAIELDTDPAGPVGQLLSAGETRLSGPEKWPDYREEFGIGPQHVDALIGIACDDALHDAPAQSNALWAPVHAWRALGQLRAEAAAEPLAALLTRLIEDDAAEIELPAVFGMIGEAAIPPLARLAADRTSPNSAVITAASAFSEIGQRHPESRGECVAALAGLLAPDRGANDRICGFAIAALIELRAVETIDAIREAFERDAVDIAIVGDIEDVEIDLRLRTERSKPPPASWLWSSRGDELSAPVVQTPVRHEKVGRNQPCPCGSGKKYKKCCLQ